MAVGKVEMASLYGELKQSPSVTPKREYFNALLEAIAYSQMVEEACNADYATNHFRENMTIEDCFFAVRAADMWNRYAIGYCV